MQSHTTQQFYHRETPLNSVEKEFFSQLRTNMLKKIAELLASDFDESSIVSVLLGRKINPYVYQACALYTFYLPLLDKILDTDCLKNREDRVNFRKEVIEAGVLVGFHFPRAHGNVSLDTMWLIKTFEYLVAGRRGDANDILTQAKSKVKEQNEAPLYLQSGYSCKMFSDNSFIFLLGHIALQNDIPLLQNKLFFREKFSRLVNRVEKIEKKLAQEGGEVESKKAEQQKPAEEQKQFAPVTDSVPKNYQKEFLARYQKLVAAVESCEDDRALLLSALDALVNFLRSKTNDSSHNMGNAFRLLAMCVEKFDYSEDTVNAIARQCGYIRHHFRYHLFDEDRFVLQRVEKMVDKRLVEQSENAYGDYRWRDGQGYMP